MRHRKKAKQLSSKIAKNKALLKNQAVSLILYEKIRTTKTRAKYLKSIVEKLITKAKAQNLKARKELISFLPKMGAVKKVMEELAPRYKDRPGGYTRIIKLGNRPGDNAPMVRIEFI